MVEYAYFTREDLGKEFIGFYKCDFLDLVHLFEHEGNRMFSLFFKFLDGQLKGEIWIGYRNDFTKKWNWKVW